MEQLRIKVEVGQYNGFPVLNFIDELSGKIVNIMGARKLKAIVAGYNANKATIDTFINTSVSKSACSCGRAYKKGEVFCPACGLGSKGSLPEERKAHL